jgi:hypothetical protein
MKTEGAQASGTLSLMQVMILIVHSRYSFTFQLPLPPLFSLSLISVFVAQRIRHELFFEFGYSLCSL